MWALDLGTTNTGLSRWDAADERPRLVELPGLCRSGRADDPFDAPRLVPSAVHIHGDPRLWDRMSRWPLMARNVFWGRWAWIGREALALNEGRIKPGFVPGFKHALGRDPLRTLVRQRGRAWSAREVARMFLRELLGAVKAATGERLRELVVTTPVASFETYRAELRALLESLGVYRVRFLDEPVAAALGYGLALKHLRRVLVVDFGGGTLDLALVELSAKDVEAGGCRVVAKAGRPLGGDAVDRWLLEEFCERLDYPLREDADDETLFWYRLMLREAQRVKEAVFFDARATFDMAPPEELRRFEARLRGESSLLEVTRADVERILSERGVYGALEGALDQVLREAGRHGLGPDAIDDVLMVGGSTLLPQVYGRVEARFGRDRVRAWQPFEAVAYGAASHAAHQIAPSDFIVNDYALLTHDGRSHEPRYTVIVPRGTRFPTPPDFWRRQLVPTCSMGVPESHFKLVVCEIGEDRGERYFSWDGLGQLHKIGEQSAPLVVPLNEVNPTLGRLEPPHSPIDRLPRLEVAFGVNAERWLCATVHDLRTDRKLLVNEPVVRLL